MTSYTARRLNSSTFRITEVPPSSKSPSDNPHIYLKFYDDLITVIDTGSVRSPGDQSPTLKDFIENTPVADNDGRPLNPGRKLDYAVVITHCHHDRIGGISALAASTLAASSAGRAFPTPACAPTLFLEDEDVFPHVSVRESPLTALHAPGLAPDALALYDPEERVLFTGGALAVAFPERGGDVAAYLRSLGRLLEFVRREGRVEVAGGRGEEVGDGDGDAQGMLMEVKGVLEGALRGEVPGRALDGGVVRYEVGGVGVQGPERVFEEGRRAIGVPAGR